MSTNWAHTAIFWHVYPLGFTGAPIRETDTEPQSRLLQLINWLDYVIELGANGLLLGPIFQSTTHGYDTTNQFTIDPRLGTEEDFAQLVDACHSRGIKIVLDGVFSHVGTEHPDVQKALAEGKEAPEAQLFDIDWDAADGPAPRVFEGHRILTRFNHANSAAQDYGRKVMQYWLKRGIDGWRLDAAYSVPHEFWQATIPPTRELYPEAWFLGEVIHGDYAEFVAASGVDTVTQYEVWKATWSSIKEKNFYELEWTLGRHNNFLNHFVPNTFIGNHDVTRIASYTSRDEAIVALVILMTIGGIPSLYYGDEQGWLGIKEERLGGDDAVRPAYPETPAELDDSGAWMLQAHQQLISIRRNHPWLVTARTAITELDNTRICYRAESVDSKQWLQVTLDITDQPYALITDNEENVLWQYIDSDR